MTQTEERLTRIWARAQSSGKWWECWQTIGEIEWALLATGRDLPEIEIWGAASRQALARITFDIREKEAA